MYAFLFDKRSLSLFLWGLAFIGAVLFLAGTLFGVHIELLLNLPKVLPIVCEVYDVDGDDRAGGAELAWIGRAFARCNSDPQSEWDETMNKARALFRAVAIATGQ